MDERVKRILYYIGIVAALYVGFVYLLPAFFSILGFAFKILWYVFIWTAAAVIVVIVSAYVVRMFKKSTE